MKHGFDHGTITPVGSVTPGPTVDGWQSASFTYTATSTSAVLSFLASGTPGGAPPFALLDSVALTDVSPTPEPSTIALGVFGVLLAVGMRRRARAAK